MASLVRYVAEAGLYLFCDRKLVRARLTRPIVRPDISGRYDEHISTRRAEQH